MRRLVFVLSLLIAGLTSSCRDASPPAPPAEPLGSQSRALAGSPLDTKADYVLGQPSLTVPTVNRADLAGVAGAQGMAVDRVHGRVYVADTSNHRVLVWLDEAALTMGRPADFALAGATSDASEGGALPGCLTPSPSTMCAPTAVAADGEGNLFVADTNNNRVLFYRWPVTNKVPDGLLGQSSFYANSCRAEPGGLCRPLALAADPVGGALFVADYANHRVLRFDAPLVNPSAQAAFGQGDADGCNTPNSADGLSLGEQLTIAVDRSVTPNRLYVADTARHRVLAWADASSALLTPPEFAIGQPNICSTGCNQGGRSARSLCQPTAIATDGTGNLYVADASNNRALRFPAPFSQWASSRQVVADLVLGQPDFTGEPRTYAPTPRTLKAPGGVAVSASGDVAVADGRRVLLFSRPLSNYQSAASVFGQNGSMTTNLEKNCSNAGYLGQTSGLAFDAAGRLLVSEANFHRVSVFDPPSLDPALTAGHSWNVAADFVYGQQSLTVCPEGGSLASLNEPVDVKVGPDGKVWISDASNLRVLGYTSAPSLPGPAATIVLTPVGTILSDCEDWPCNYWPVPAFVDVDSSGNVLVGDGSRHRIATYLSPSSSKTGPDRVLGQPNGTSIVQQSRIDATRLSSPTGVALDRSAAPPVLYVADAGNNRVLAFEDALRLGSGASANAAKVFGQADASSAAWCTIPVSRSRFCSPRSVATDASGNLFVSDLPGHRVLEFDRPLATPSGSVGDLLADRVFGQTDFDRSAEVKTPSADVLWQPVGVGLDSAGRLLVADLGNNRILRYDAPLGAQTPVAGAPASLALGQGTLTEGALNGTSRAGLNGPRGIALDRSSSPPRLYVADTNNHRVLGWADAWSFQDGAPADLVIGQPDQWSSRPPSAASDTRLSSPAHLAVDAQGNLYVSDTGHQRVVMFPSPFAPGSPSPLRATRLFGQTTYSAGGSSLADCAPLGTASACTVSGLAVDAAGRLYVAEKERNRVLGYPPGQTTATVVLGQLGSFTTSTENAGGLGARSLSAPAGLTVDPQGRLLVVDQDNCRVLRFPTPGTPGADSADLVLLQPDFATGCGSIRTYLTEVASNATALFVRDGKRIFEYPLPQAAPPPLTRTFETAADDGWWYGPPVSCRASPYFVCYPEAFAADEAGTLFVADSYAHRVSIHLGNLPALALQPQIQPGAPRVGDALSVSYAFQDPEGQTESGTRIAWYRDGARLSQYDDLKALPANALGGRGERWHAVVRAGDGLYPGVPVETPVVTVRNSPPSVSGVTLTPANPTRLTGLTVSWTYSDPDGDPAGPALVRWFVDGAPTFHGGESLPPEALARGQSWRAVVTPFDGFEYGAGTSAPTEVTVGNSPPEASSAAITPAQPTSSQTLRAEIAVTDIDGDPAVGLITWYKNPVLGGGDGTPTPPVESAAATAAPGPLVSGDRWQFSVIPFDNLARGAPRWSQIVTIDSTEPSATNLAITPASPTSADPLTATYTFVSVDGNTDRSTLRWYLGGVEQADLRDQRTVAAARITRGQIWYFTLLPHDGLKTGTLQTSGAVTIANSSPRGIAATISPAPVARTADTLTAVYDFTDPDGDEDKSVPVWFRNTVEHSRGPEIPPGATVRGDVWWYEVRLSDGSPQLGPLRVSNQVTIQNTPPAALSPTITPANPRKADTLTAGFQFADDDGDSSQTTKVSWTLGGSPQPSLDGAWSVPSASLAKGQRWSFTVIPYDGSAEGAPATSPQVTVLNTAPEAKELAIVPTAPQAGDALTASFQFEDVDGDPRAAQTTITWERNGEVWGTGETVPAGTVKRGETWRFMVTPHDGSEAGTPVQSEKVTIGNRAPRAENLRVEPPSPRIAEDLVAAYDFVDPDGDSEGNTRIDWTLNGQPFGSSERIPRATLRKGQVWSFRVTPSDWQSLGEPVALAVPVQILNTPPTAEAGPARVELDPDPATASQRVELNAAGSTDPDGDNLEYEWTIDDLAPLAEQQVSLELSVGSHLARLRVFDGTDWSQNEETVAISIRDEPISVSVAGGDRTVPPGTVSLEAVVEDPLHREASFHWTRLSGEAVTIDGELTASASFFALAAGERVFEVVATAGANTASAQVTLRTAQVAPFAALEGRYVLEPNQRLTLDASDSSDPNADALTWRWTAGPGLSLEADGPRATVSAAEDGRYTLELIVDDGQADSPKRSAEILVLDPSRPHAPVADAAPAAWGGDFRAVRLGDEVKLDGSESYDVDGDVLRYRWRLLDGAPASVAVATFDPSWLFTPAVPGDYVFGLTVRDDELASEEHTVTVHAYDPMVERNRAPTAHAGIDQLAQVRQRVQLDGSNSTDPERQALLYRWTQVWGPTVTLEGADGATPSFSALRPGLLRFELAVSDRRDALGEPIWSPPARVAIYVLEEGRAQPEVAVTGGGRVGLQPPPRLQARAASGEGPPPAGLRYRWTQTSGPPVVLSDASGEATEVRARGPGRYGFALTAWDGQTPSAPATVTIEVSTHLSGNQPPLAVASGPATAATGEAVQLRSVGSSDPDPLDQLRYRWDVVGFPDGSAPELDDPSAPNPTFTPVEPGTYSVRLVVSDGDLSSAPAYAYVTVTADAPSGTCSTSSGGARALLGLLALAALATGARRRGPRTARGGLAVMLLAATGAATGCREPQASPRAQPVAARRQAVVLPPLDIDPDQVLGQISVELTAPNGVDAAGMSSPRAIAIDSRPGKGHVYVADASNNRVLAWASYSGLTMGKAADRVLGQTDANRHACTGASPSQLCFPKALAVDASGNLFVADTNNNRVVRFDTPFDTDLVADKVFGQTTLYGRVAGALATQLSAPSGVAVGDGYLFVSDTGNSRLLRYALSSAANPPAAQTMYGGGLGPAAVSSPLGLSLDLARTPHSLYVADSGNSRVLKIDDPGATAVPPAARAVGQGDLFSGGCNGGCLDDPDCGFLGCGDPGQGNLCFPVAVHAGPDRLWVSDGEMRYYTAGDGFCGAVDGDRLNQRVVGFAYGTWTPDRLIGQPSWSSQGCNRGGLPAANTVCYPQGMASAPDGSLLLADAGNDRVVRYPSPVANDAAATLTLGQTRLSEAYPNSLDARSLRNPQAVAVDRSVSPNRIYVADTGNNRVLGWADETRRNDGLPADLVLGQTAFDTGNPALAQNRLNAPSGLAVDASGNLYVADTGNHRVLFFPTPFQNGNGAPAGRVYGQTGYTAGSCNQGTTSANPSRLCSPKALALDASGALYVADYGNFRVLRFPAGQTTATRAYGQIDLLSRSSAGCAAATVAPETLCRPAGIALDAQGRLFVADATNYAVVPAVAGPNRVVGIETPETNSTASIVLGLPDLYAFPTLYTDAYQGLKGVASSGSDLLVLHETNGAAGKAVTERVSDVAGLALVAQTFDVWLIDARGASINSCGNLYVADGEANRVLLYLANRAPRALSLAIAPAAPVGGSALTASWVFNDPDLHAEAQSSVRWFRDGVHAAAYDGANPLPAGVVRRNERWSFEVRPSDGYEYGDAVLSPEVTVGNAAPTATVQVVGTSSGATTGITTSDGLTAVISYSDPDGDPAGPPIVSWYQDNVHQPFDGSLTVPASATGRLETWQVRVRPFDGQTPGAEVTASTLIVNRAPSASAVRIEPASPLSTGKLEARWSFSDPDAADQEAGTRWTWRRNGAVQDTYTNLREVPPPLKAGDVWVLTVEPGDGLAWGPPVSSAAVTVRSADPTATGLTISPSAPTSSDALTARYTFVTYDGFLERNSVLAWYRDGQPAGLAAATVPASALARGQRWHFALTPCDDHGGCGATLESAPVTVLNSPPSVSAPSITPAGPRLGDELVAHYDFFDIDGDTDFSSFTWYRNGAAQAFADDHVAADQLRHFDSWYFTIRSNDGTLDGNAATSPTVLVENTPPAARDVAISPAAPRKTDALTVEYLFEDVDGDPDQSSEYRWRLNGVEEPTLTGRQVPSARLVKGQVWVATVRPKDGYDFGPAVSSTPVTIRNSPPIASNLRLTDAQGAALTSAPITGDALYAAFDYADPDNTDPANPADPEATALTQVRWFKDGADAGLTGRSVPAGVIERGERWSFSVRPHDGTELGAEAALPGVLVGNKVPVASNPLLAPDLPTAQSTLVASYEFADPEGDGESGSLLTWYRQGVEEPTLRNHKRIDSSDGVPLRKGEEWFFRLAPGDGSGARGAEIQSAAVTIGNLPPIADAGEYDTFVATGVTTRVTLDGSGSRDPDVGDALSYQWTVDGSLQAQGVAPTFDLSIGSHSVTLMVSDSDHASASASTTIYVANRRPEISFEASRFVPPGHVRLEAQVKDPIDRPMEYQWTQLSGEAVVLSGAAGALASGVRVVPPATFFARTAGERVFELVVRTTGTELQATERKSAAVMIEDLPPFAAAFPKVVVPVGEPALLDGSESADPNGKPLTFTWTQTKGESAEILSGDTAVAQLLPPAEGRYEAKLTVSDGVHQSPETAASIVRIQAIDRRAAGRLPVANAGPDLYAEVGASVVLDASQSYDLDGDELEFSWRQVRAEGDDLAAVSLEQSGARARFVPRQSGTYRFALSVAAAAQVSGEDEVEVVVADDQISTRPVAELVLARWVDGAAVPLSGGPVRPRDRLVLDGSASFDPKANEVRYEFTQTWGAPVTLEAVAAKQRAFTVLGTGLHRFRLVVRQAGGSQYASAPAEVVVQVVDDGNQPPTVNAGHDLIEPRLVGSEIQLRGSASDPDSDELTWRWMQLEGTPVPLIPYDAAEPRFTPKAVGRYTFRAMVSDGQVASLPDDVSVIVKTHGATDELPIAVATAPGTVAAGVEITLDGSGSYDPDPLDRLKHRWEIVGMPTGEAPALGTPAAPTTTFLAKAAGDYAVRLTVTDGERWSAPVFVQINVTGGEAPEALPCGCSTGAGAPLAASALVALALRRRRR